MQGQGPSTSQGGRLVDMNLIIASKDALAADMVAANIMGFDPFKMFRTLAKRMGLKNDT
jgi:uncharacterized protein (DUF362 family)